MNIAICADENFLNDKIEVLTNLFSHLNEQIADLNEKRVQDRSDWNELKVKIDNNEIILDKKVKQLTEKLLNTSYQVNSQLSMNISYLQRIPSDLDYLNKTFSKISQSLSSKLFGTCFSYAA